MTTHLKPLVAAVALGLVASIAPIAQTSSEAAVPVPASTSVSAYAGEPTVTVTLVAKKFKNCTALHKKYKHGVGRKGAHDKVRGHTKPVTNFKRDTALYKRNKALDRDKDGVACEQR